MEIYAVLLLLFLIAGIFLVTAKAAQHKIKLRWLQGIITFAVIGVYVLWFVYQTDFNLNGSSQWFDLNTDHSDTAEHNHLKVIQVGIFTSINFLLIFVNLILMIRSFKIERKVILQ